MEWFHAGSILYFLPGNGFLCGSNDDEHPGRARRQLYLFFMVGDLTHTSVGFKVSSPAAWTADVSEFGMWQNFSGHDGGGHCSRTMLIRVSFHNFGPDSDLWTAIGWIALKFVQT